LRLADDDPGKSPTGDGTPVPLVDERCGEKSKSPWAEERALDVLPSCGEPCGPYVAILPPLPAPDAGPPDAGAADGGADAGALADAATALDAAAPDATGSPDAGVPMQTAPACDCRGGRPPAARGPDVPTVLLIAVIAALPAWRHLRRATRTRRGGRGLNSYVAAHSMIRAAASAGLVFAAPQRHPSIQDDEPCLPDDGGLHAARLRVRPGPTRPGRDP
jgi:hypothetical protein